MRSLSVPSSNVGNYWLPYFNRFLRVLNYENIPKWVICASIDVNAEAHKTKRLFRKQMVHPSC